MIAGRASLILCLGWLVACGSSDDGAGIGINTGGSGSGVGASTGAGASASTGTAASPGISLGGAGAGGESTAGTGGGRPIGNGMPELCDGLDNDANGIVDDRDTGNDGICDCLRIATLGLPGQWGEGDVFDMWLDSRSDSGAIDLNDQVLTPELLAPFQVIVVQDVSKMGRSYSEAEVQAFNGWLANGSGVMILIGYADASERANVNALLAMSGLSYADQPILQKQGGNTIPITGWQPHPVTEGVQQIGVDNGYPVAGATPSLASESSFDLLRAGAVGGGRVLVWGDEWITYNSEWSEHPEYQVELFWVNAIKWLTPAAECQVPVPPSIPR